MILACMLMALGVARAANVLDRVAAQDGAICDDRIPAYLVVDAHKVVGGENKIVYKDLDERDCKNLCTDNKDDQGNQVMCSSYTYNIKERTCTVHRGKASPVGKLELKPAQGHRYYEKFCLPEGTPADCGEKTFFRADQAVLVGFAKNVSHTKNLVTCIQACIEMSAECRSAMFFGGAGECILSVASAQDAPDVFAEEEDEENVVYFENGCVMENQIRSQKIHSVKQKGEKKAQAKLATNSTISKAANATASSEKKSEEKMKEKKSEEEERPKKLTSDEETEEESETQAPKDDSQEQSKSKSKSKSGSRKSSSSSTKAKNKLLQAATNQAEDAWGAWSEECRSFDERRPCQNGNRVGFQSRQCLRTPFECQGPFFRYCIAPC